MGKIACIGKLEKIHPDAILEMAKCNLDEVIVVGTDMDGNLWVSASTTHLDRIYWLLNLAAHKCIDVTPFERKVDQA